MSTTDEEDSVRRVTVNPAAVFILALMDGDIVGSLIVLSTVAMYRLVVSPRSVAMVLASSSVRSDISWGCGA